MVVICREEIMSMLNERGFDQLEVLEENLGRELNDEELKDMIIYLIGYYNFRDNRTLGDLVANIGLEDSLSEEEYNKIEDVEL